MADHGKIFARSFLEDDLLCITFGVMFPLGFDQRIDCCHTDSRVDKVRAVSPLGQFQRRAVQQASRLSLGIVRATTMDPGEGICEAQLGTEDGSGPYADPDVTNRCIFFEIFQY